MYHNNDHMLRKKIIQMGGVREIDSTEIPFICFNGRNVITFTLSLCSQKSLFSSNEP